MTDLQQRIDQWETMAREAPDGMAFFSLGNAYKDAERYEDAAEAMRKAIEHDPGLSRAYQVLGQVLIKLGRNDEAGVILTAGYKVAAERGDVMPQRAMGSLLEEKLSLPIPEVAKPAAPEAAEPEPGGDRIIDRRTGLPGTRLPDPPMRGPVGRYIYDHFSQETWREWIAQGTKVINELHLDFSNPAYQDLYERQMLEWLGVSEEEVKEYAGK